MALTTIFPPSQCVLNLVNTNQSTTSLTSAIYSLVHRPLPPPPSLEKINKWFFSDIYFYQSVSCSSSWSIHVISYFLQLSEKWLFTEKYSFLSVGWFTMLEQLLINYDESSSQFPWRPPPLHWAGRDKRDSIQTGDCLHYRLPSSIWISAAT